MDNRLLDVDRYGTLRVPGVMWLSFAVLTRHWFLCLFMVMSGQAWTSGEVPWLPMLAQVPVALLLLVGGRRMPDAGPLPRQIWRLGPKLVTATATLNLCWVGWVLFRSDEWRPRPELMLVCFSALDLAIAWSICTSRYLSQVFTEFPVSESK